MDVSGVRGKNKVIALVYKHQGMSSCIKLVMFCFASHIFCLFGEVCTNGALLETTSNELRFEITRIVKLYILYEMLLF